MNFMDYRLRPAPSSCWSCLTRACVRSWSLLARELGRFRELSTAIPFVLALEPVDEAIPAVLVAIAAKPYANLEGWDREGLN